MTRAVKSEAEREASEAARQERDARMYRCLLRYPSMTLAEIGARYGLSEARTSRILTREMKSRNKPQTP